MASAALIQYPADPRHVFSRASSENLKAATLQLPSEMIADLDSIGRGPWPVITRLKNLTAAMDTATLRNEDATGEQAQRVSR